MLRNCKLLVGNTAKIRYQSTAPSILRTSDTLKRPMFRYRYYNENYDMFKEICEKRNVKFSLGEDYSEIFTEYKASEAAIMAARSEAKNLQIQMKKLSSKKNEATEELKAEREQIRQRMSDIKPFLKEEEKIISDLEDELLLRCEGLPNLIDPAVSDEQVLVKYLNPTQDLLDSKETDYPLTPNEKLDHKDIMENMNLIDFDNASRLAGRGWYYLLGDAALLEQALVQYALSKARSHGFKMIIPPSIVKTEVTSACGFKPRDANNETQVYELKSDNLCLTGTAEIPLAGLYSSREFKVSQLPLRNVGVSRSYRAEAGASGRDTRGLYRVHEFTKVELFVWTENSLEASNSEFDRLVDFQIDFINSLGLTARVLMMPYDDLGSPAYKKIDIEALMPGRGKWGEVSSTSNCLDYQSRRLTTRYRDPTNDNKMTYTHTLNGTAAAIPRLIVAIVENFYDADTESILIPEVLRPYMDNMERIYKN